MNKISEKKFLTTQETASLINVSIPTLNRWRCEGKGLPYYKIGNTVRYGYDDIMNFMKKCKTYI